MVGPVTQEDAGAGAITADPAQVVADARPDRGLGGGVAAELGEEAGLKVLGQLEVQRIDQRGLVLEVGGRALRRSPRLGFEPPRGSRRPVRRSRTGRALRSVNDRVRTLSSQWHRAFIFTYRGILCYVSVRAVRPDRTLLRADPARGPAPGPAIRAALGDARHGRQRRRRRRLLRAARSHVIAIEPSDVMASQRPRRARAGDPRGAPAELPLRDRASTRRWRCSRSTTGTRTGSAACARLRRVARGPVVILTYRRGMSAQMWLMADYLPEVAAARPPDLPAADVIAGWLGGTATRRGRSTIPRDTPIGRSVPSGPIPSVCSILSPAARPRGLRGCARPSIERVVTARRATI